MMVNIDIGLTIILKKLSHSLEICTIHSNERIIFPLWLFGDQFTSFQMTKGSRQAIHQNDLEGLARVPQGESQPKQGPNRITIRADVGRDDNILCILWAYFERP